MSEYINLELSEAELMVTKIALSIFKDVLDSGVTFQGFEELTNDDKYKVVLGDVLDQIIETPQYKKLILP